MQEGDSEETFFNKKNKPQCKRGVVVDIVNSNCNCVSDNFIVTCLLLLSFEDVIKAFESLTLYYFIFILTGIKAFLQKPTL